jgi:hypothetical protein
MTNRRSVPAWEEQCLARRRDLVVRVHEAEAELDKHFGDSRPEGFWYVAEEMLGVAVEVAPDDEIHEVEAWRTWWQLAYFRFKGRWQFLLADEIMPPGRSGEGLMAPPIPLVDAPNAALLFYGSRIDDFAVEVRQIAEWEKSDEFRERRQVIVNTQASNRDDGGEARHGMHERTPDEPGQSH